MNDVPAAMSNASIMVNATPLGMTGKPPMIPDVIDGLANVDANATVFDTVYAPLETGLLRHSRKIGLHTVRSEEHTSELQSLMRISSAVFCFKTKKRTQRETPKSNRDYHY